MLLSDEPLREGLGWSRADEQVGASWPRQEDVAPSLPLLLPMAA